ncbi:MAG TPA: chemotaxis protein CheW [Elusimicrobiota bacterium]|nr:chemotaxis protein CheW [Elusimicrobiota bacterium]
MRSASFDWNELRRRLNAFQQLVESGGALSDEQKKSILRERAKALARVPEAEVHGEKRLEALKFQLAAETYAVELGFVGEVYAMKGFTIVPCTPGHIFGVVNVRGRLLSVIDIKKLFGLPRGGLTDQNKVVVLHHDGVELGLLADAVIGVGLILENDLQSSLPTFTGIQTEYFRGVTKERTIILDGEKLLKGTGLVVNEEV